MTYRQFTRNDGTILLIRVPNDTASEPPLNVLEEVIFEYPDKISDLEKELEHTKNILFRYTG